MRYKVTTLTPLLVSDGRELSPIDYMVWKDQVNVLDQTRIFKLLARGPRLEGYLTQLRKATKLDFASWGGFAQNFSQRRVPFEDPGLTATWNTAPPDSLFIPTFAASYRGAYLPASALKGALRTGLAFSRWQAGTIDRLAASLEGDRAPRRLAESAEANSQMSQMRVLSMADSEPVPTSAFKIFLTRTASLDTRQAGKPQLVWKVAGRGSVPPQRVSDATPVFAEMALPGTEFEGRWEERTFLENPELSRALGWRSAPDVPGITAAANQYAAAQLDLHSNFASATDLPELRQTVEGLKTELTALRETSSGCLLCLGWGAGFSSKAAFPDTALDSYRKILRTVPSISSAIRDNVPFPKTRRVVFAGGKPAALPGWVKIHLEK
ncbi:MAG TPA: RAMP superfamily CRISPR-associated protein [Bryobacteraceae bacterium]|jgi:CRISPR-associated protein Csm5